ncbi:MAG TPA: sugar transferase [Acidimicrobiia bacterium]|nr:sugar transferase [Acidimicrobiia bacterium]
MKRALDAAVSALALVILSPLLLVIAALVRWRLGSPVLFRQERPGLHAKPFTLVKFRTMSLQPADPTDGSGDQARLDPFGAKLRSTSLDELPELWNVLKGDMSLVGPRPLLMHYLPLYSERQARRHEVRPGVTGWAQINGRNATPWPERLEMDVWYVENRSMWLDLKILAMTVPSALRRSGVTQEGQATVEYFTGSET